MKGKDIQQNQKEMLHCEASPFGFDILFYRQSGTKARQEEINGHKKQLTRKYLASCLWAILGLNQGPPDYESVALTN